MPVHKLGSLANTKSNKSHERYNDFTPLAKQ